MAAAANTNVTMPARAFMEGSGRKDTALSASAFGASPAQIRHILDRMRGKERGTWNHGPSGFRRPSYAVGTLAAKERPPLPASRSAQSGIQAWPRLVAPLAGRGTAGGGPPTMPLAEEHDCGSPSDLPLSQHRGGPGGGCGGHRRVPPGTWRRGEVRAVDRAGAQPSPQARVGVCRPTADRETQKRAASPVRLSRHSARKFPRRPVAPRGGPAGRGR